MVCETYLNKTGTNNKKKLQEQIKDNKPSSWNRTKKEHMCSVPTVC